MQASSGIAAAPAAAGARAQFGNPRRSPLAASPKRAKSTAKSSHCHCSTVPLPNPPTAKSPRQTPKPTTTASVITPHFVYMNRDAQRHEKLQARSGTIHITPLTVASPTNINNVALAI
jgi:hypothetical protein